MYGIGVREVCDRTKNKILNNRIVSMINNTINYLKGDNKFYWSNIFNIPLNKYPQLYAIKMFPDTHYAVSIDDTRSNNTYKCTINGLFREEFEDGRECVYEDSIEFEFKV